MQLSDFFSQLNFFNISVFLFSFLVFDAVGARIACLIRPANYLRITYWLWGMGIFVFTLFLLHLFLPFKAEYIWLTLFLFGIISLPDYFRNRDFHSLISSVKKFPFPLFTLIFLVKPVYFLISAPPYYADEMNYQFYSPARLVTESRWPFVSSFGGVVSPSLYEMIPKTLNTAYWGFFSLAHTYVVARLLHFLIVFCVIYAVAMIIANKISKVAGILYSVFALLLSANFIYFSTLGYVDAAPAALAVLFLILIIDYLLKPKKEKLYSASMILGLMVGMKYTIFVFAFSVLITGFLIFLYQRKRKIRETSMRSLKNFFGDNIKSFTAIPLIFIIFGGYWYLKNFLISGNPIYPLFFKCLFGWQCGVGNAFFSGWTSPFDRQHIWNILMELFQNNSAFFYSTFILCVMTLIFSFVHKIRFILLLTLTIIFSVLFEVLLSKNSTGFILRYYFHWLLIIPLVLVFPIGLLNIEKPIFFFNRKIILVVTLLLLVFPTSVLAKNIKRLYEGDFVPGYVRNYAMNRINLNNWIDYYYPGMNEFIKWCGTKRSMQDILVIDPNLIWYSTEAGMRAFLVNCNLIHPEISAKLPASGIAEFIEKKYSNYYLVSYERCKSKFIEGQFLQDPEVKKRYEVNQLLVCNHQGTVKNTYILQK